MPVRSLKDGTITIRDGGTGSAQNTVTVTIEEGDLSFTERHPVNVILDRGVLDHARKANEEPINLSFSVRFQSFSQPTTSLYDALTQTDGASAWVNAAATTDAYAVELQFVLADVDNAFGGPETLVFDPFHVEEIAFNEGDPHDTLAVSGRVVAVGPTIT